MVNDMIYLEDNFLSKKVYDQLLIDLAKSEYRKVTEGGKDFWIQTVSNEFITYVEFLIGQIENKEIKSILSFFRRANEDEDTDWRIHADSIITDRLPDRAAVLYLSKPTENLSGTAFWKHKELGYKLDNKKNFNKILLEDSNDETKWELNTVIGHKENRLVSYPSNYFHSKYPNKHLNNREVFVIFYNI